MKLSLLGIMLLTFGVNSGFTAVKPFETVGLYVWRDTPDQHAFWKASGINTLQFCDIGWHLRDDLLDDYYKGFVKDIDSAKKAGFKVYVILFSNIKQWPGPEEHSDGLGLRYHPNDKKEMDSRLKYIGNTVEKLKAADGFTFFAGDPGGVPAELGESNVYMWISMVERVRTIVKKEAPHADFNVNPWSITQWQYPNLGAFGKDFWLKETELFKIITEENNFIGPDTGIEIPPHNYYRSLTLKTYDEESIIPKPYPKLSDIKKLKDRGTERVWVWPYFLLDEADDGYIGTIWRNRGMLQIETRYIHKLVCEMDRINPDGIIGSWSYAGYLPNALNTYAFGRFCTDPKLKPIDVIEEYASYLAEDESKDSLVQIMKFVENNSTWHASLPNKYRLPLFDTGDLKSAYLAQIRLDRIKVRSKSNFPLPEPPEEYLKHLKLKLNDMVAHERAPEVTIDTNNGELITMVSGNWAGDESSIGGLDALSSPSADKACGVVCTISDTGYPQRLDIPVEIRKDHTPERIGIGFIKGSLQNETCSIYWDDMLIGKINAYDDSPDHVDVAYIDLLDQLKTELNFKQGIHVLSISVEPTVFWAISYFKLDSILIPD